jgi:hypothetical protein
MGEVTKTRIGDEIWSRETVDDRGETGAFCSLAAGSDRHPSIAYWTSHEGPDARLLWSRRKQEGEWEIEEVDRVRGAGAAHAIDTKNQPWVVYYDLENSALKARHRRGTSWGRQETAAAGLRGFTVGTTSLVLVGDAPRATFWSDAGLKLARRSATRWLIQAEVIDARGTAGLANSLASDGSEALQATYYDLASQSFHLARRDGGDWKTKELIDDGKGGFAGEHNCLAVERTTKVSHIGYWTDAGLRYTRRGGAQLPVELVEAGSGAGLYPSIALNGQGIPHISFHDVDKRLIRLARRINGRWNSITLDQGISGAYSSVAVDDLGGIHIAYQDAAKGDLRFASLVLPPVARFKEERGLSIVDLDGAAESTGDGLTFQWIIGIFAPLQLEGGLNDPKIRFRRPGPPGTAEVRLRVTDRHGRSSVTPPEDQPPRAIRL